MELNKALTAPIKRIQSEFEYGKYYQKIRLIPWNDTITL